MLTVSTYIHLNPVRAKIVERPEDYKWSSFSYYVKNLNSFSWIYIDDILSMFSRERNPYKSFVYNKMESKKGITKEEMAGKYSILGGEKFREKIIQMVITQKREENIREIPDLKHIRRQNISALALKNLVLLAYGIDEKKLIEKKHFNNYYKLYLYGLKKYSNLSLREIGIITGIDYSSVSKSVCRFIQATKTNSELKKMLNRFEKEVLTKMSNVET